MKKLATFAALAPTFSTTGAFAASMTGWVSDSMCSKDTKKVSSADHAACAKKCIGMGDKAVFVVGDKVYAITNPDTVASHVGDKVTLDATVKGDSITVNSVK